MLIHPKNIQEFEAAVSHGTVLVDFFATWCGPCRMLTPVLEEISEENNDILIVKLDVDEVGEVAMRFGIQAVPTLILFKDGQPVAKAQGYQPKESLLEFLKK